MIQVNPATGEVIDEEQACFQSRQGSIFPTTDSDDTFNRIAAKIIEAFSTYLKNGSGWMLKRVVRLDITISRLNPLKGSFHIPLPNKILRSKAVTNMKNNDDECFKWAITRALFPAPKNAERITKELRKQAEGLHWNDIEFPTPCSSKMFKKFEKTITSHYSCLATQARVGTYILFLCMFQKSNVRKPSNYSSKKVMMEKVVITVLLTTLLG